MNEETLWEIVGEAVHVMRDDEAWRNYGFTRTPRRGFVFDWFVPLWKLELEAALLRLFIATTIAFKRRRRDVADEVVEQALTLLTAEPGMVKLYRLPDQATAIQKLKALSDRFSETHAIENWATIIIEETAASKLPSKHFRARVLVGAVRFAVNLNIAYNLHPGRQPAT